MSDDNGTSDQVVYRRWYEDQRQNVYVVVDLKCDGGDVRRNSMRTLAAVAVAENGFAISNFSRNVSTIEGAVSDKHTLALFRDHIEAWRINTKAAERAAVAIRDFAIWVKSLPGQAVLVAAPLTQTAIWLDSYLRRFTRHGVYHGPYEIEPLFYGAGIDLMSLVMGATGCDYRQAVEHMLPSEWRGHRIETHDAREDVLMHSEVLFAMLKLRKTLPPIT
jgi:hypothetical protein